MVLYVLQIACRKSIGRHLFVTRRGDKIHRIKRGASVALPLFRPMKGDLAKGMRNEEVPHALRAGGKEEVIKGNLSLRDREFLPAAEGTCP